MQFKTRYVPNPENGKQIGVELSIDEIDVVRHVYHLVFDMENNSWQDKLRETISKKLSILDAEQQEKILNKIIRDFA